ncbi:hypothetical protein AJ80_09810 [Polytolypa hystricis UAMH7299]|uniref:Uncharacterized protein n=1 Tax=Polytolypa hystricis (strain UAMH7299) TaxID=1447883 RepID=A0A2B7WJ95_POLH7|nr:hypothetical protein AJ80_09810 [Polytolypa hystricis UAMH7299]
MANAVYYYFLSPTWHNHPKSGTLQLGNIFTNLKQPEQPLYRGPPPPPPKLVDTPPDPESDERTESWQTDYEFSTEQLRAGNKGVVYTFDTLSTIEFLPTDAYIQECLKSRAVARYLEQTRRQPNNRKLYIVTGIKAVSGARGSGFESSAHATTAGFELDSTAVGVPPVSFSPETKIRREGKAGVKWLGSSDFVFAYRVRRIDVDGETGEARGHKDYTKGAMLGKSAKGAVDVPFSLVEVGLDDLEDAGLVEENVGEAVLAVDKLEAGEGAKNAE